MMTHDGVMQLTPYLESVAGDLDRATQLADEDTREIARRLVTVLEPGLRLAMVHLLSDAAAELTADLEGPVVTVRMEGRDPVWNVLRTDAPEATPPSIDNTNDADEQGIARVTVRLPESVKRRADAAAQRAGQSLNAWIVHALRSAASADHTATRSSRRITGWA
jgi:hypothetical protein